MKKWYPEPLSLAHTHTHTHKHTPVYSQPNPQTPTHFVLLGGASGCAALAREALPVRVCEGEGGSEEGGRGGGWGCQWEYNGVCACVRRERARAQERERERKRERERERAMGEEAFYRF